MVTFYWLGNKKIVHDLFFRYKLEMKAYNKKLVSLL